MEFFLSRIPNLVHKMADGNIVECEVVRDADESKMHEVLFLLTQHMIEDKNMVVGLDTEWGFAGLEATPLLLKLGTRHGCVLIKLNPTSRSVSLSLRNFLIMKDIMFVGIGIHEEAMKLKTECGLEVRNPVELSELAAKILGQPRLAAFSLSGLAREFLSVNALERSLSLRWVESWFAECLTNDQIECATVDAYLTYILTEKLLGLRRERISNPFNFNFNS